MFKEIIKISFKENTEVNNVNYMLQSSDFKFEFKIEKQYLGFEAKDYSLKNKINKANLKNKSIYRYSKIKLPRDKVDLLKNSCNLKVTRDKKNADYHIISSDMMRHMCTTKLYRKTSMSQLKKNIEIIDKRIETTSAENKFFLEALNLKISEFCIENPDITLDDRSVYLNLNFTWYRPNVVQVTNGVSIKIYRDVWENLFPAKNKQWFHIAKNNYDASTLDTEKHVLDSTLIDIASESLAVLKSSDYESIKTMINSHDRQDIDMAVQIMANCNYEKSKDVVGLLYAFNHEKLRYASNWNHINVKAMRNAFKAYDFYFQRGNSGAHNRLIEELMNGDSLTEFAVKTICEHMFETVLEHNFGHVQNLFDISLKDVKLKAHVIEKIKKDNLEIQYLPY